MCFGVNPNFISFPIKLIYDSTSLCFDRCLHHININVSPCKFILGKSMAWWSVELVHTWHDWMKHVYDYDYDCIYIYMIWYVIWYVIWISEYVYDNLASCFLLDKQRVAYNQGHEITINPGYLCYVELWMSCPEHSITIQDHIIDVNKIIKSYTSYTTSIKSFMFQVMQCIPSYIILLYYHIESYYIIEPSHHHP